MREIRRDRLDLIRYPRTPLNLIIFRQRLSSGAHPAPPGPPSSLSSSPTAISLRGMARKIGVRWESSKLSNGRESLEWLRSPTMHLTMSVASHSSMPGCRCSPTLLVRPCSQKINVVFPVPSQVSHAIQNALYSPRLPTMNTRQPVTFVRVRRGREGLKTLCDFARRLPYSGTALSHPRGLIYMRHGSDP